MLSRGVPMVVAVSFTCIACAGGNGARPNDWKDIDYSGVYRAAGQRDVDSAYKMPTVINCVDDDLYNCNK